jgi:hypothetical protein
LEQGGIDVGLGLYEQTGPASFKKFSIEGEQLVPIQTTHNGREGEIVEKLLFLRNDDATKYYTNITIDPTDSDSDDDTVLTDTGWGVRVNDGSLQPSEAQWQSVTPGDPINMVDIGVTTMADTTTYFPFYYRIEVPRNSRVQTKTDISLTIQAVENVVTP